VGRAAIEVAVWWAVLTVVYIATLSVVTGPELLGAAACAAACAVLAVAARRAARARWRPERRWTGWLAPLAVSIAADTVRLFALVLPRLFAGRPSGGKLRTMAQPGDERARSAARRAFGTLVLSASPGSIVLDWPADGSPIVLHELGSGPPSLPEAVTR
jgi:hypothetical protein